MPANLGDAEETEALPGRVEEALGDLHILVNNAGLTRDMLALRLSDDQWQSVLDVNLTSAFRLSRAALRGMMRRRHGRIINIASIVGVTGNPGQANYAASKAGMIGMTKSMAAEVAARGVTLNCIAPGFVRSPMTDALSEQQQAGLLERIPGRADRRARRHRRRRGLPGERRGGLGHRPDRPRQRRHGHDLRGHSDRPRRVERSGDLAEGVSASFAGSPSIIHILSI